MTVARLRRVSAAKGTWRDRLAAMRGPLVAIASVGAVLSGLVGYYTTYRAVTETKPVSHVPTIEADPSIAVLPLVNLSSDKEQEYFSDGIAEDLIALLARAPNLRVIARTSSFSFKGRNVPIEAIARQLNVASVLEGSVRRSGDTVRIKLQLVRATDSTPVWSATYDRSMHAILQVQDEVANAVAVQLHARLLGSGAGTAGRDPKVYERVLQARALARLHTPESGADAERLYREAMALAPRSNYARVGLAWLYLDRGSTTGVDDHRTEFRIARQLAQEALAIDPGNAHAHAQLANVASVLEHDFGLAARHLERALDIEPANSAAPGSAVVLSRRLGRSDDAVRVARYRVTLDPASPNVHSQLAAASALAGRWPDAVDALRTALRLTPTAGSLHAALADALLAQGDATGALAESQLEPHPVWRSIALGAAYHSVGRTRESGVELANLVAKHSVTASYNIAEVYAFREEPDRAFEWLEKALAIRDSGLIRAPGSHMLKPLHQDARWLPFLRKAGMAPDQLAAVKFEVRLPAAAKQ
ncbi:MAG: tetratricopeptide repeat protein [Burkholderiales bacterium]|nr:tetratricopeptide repeat protein [Burkholderiales bacterium]